MKGTRCDYCKKLGHTPQGCYKMVRDKEAMKREKMERNMVIDSGVRKSDLDDTMFHGDVSEDVNVALKSEIEALRDDLDTKLRIDISQKLQEFRPVF